MDVDLQLPVLLVIVLASYARTVQGLRTLLEDLYFALGPRLQSMLPMSSLLRA